MAYAAKPPACQGCPAYTFGLGFVPPEIPTRHTELVVIGQGPGAAEAHSSRPFHPDAPSGGMLTRWLNEAGWQRSRVLLTNVVWCWLPKSKGPGHATGSRDPKVSEINYCKAAHWGPLLSRYPDTLTVTVGAPATRAILGVETVSKYVGTFNHKETLL